MVDSRTARSGARGAPVRSGARSRSRAAQAERTRGLTDALVGGIPAAVAIVRWQERRQSTSAQAEQRKQEVVRESRLRAMIRAELDENLDTFKCWRKAISSGTILANGFARGRWDVLCASGNL